MAHKKTTIVAIFLFLILGILGGVTVLKGGLYIGKHEGDTMHLMQIVFRMAEGQTPHYDFMTPIGALAFWPIAALVKAGLGIGMAVIWSQVIAAAMFLPIVLWTVWTRLTAWVGALFGLIVMVLLLALIHGETEQSISMSMHYNRLAWAAAFVAILNAVVAPERDRTGTVDGVIIGLMVCVMAMIKATYVISFAVPIVVALVLTKQSRALVVAVVTGLSVVAIISVFNGVGYWAAYAGDLLLVAGSEVRAAPGQSIKGIMGAPAYIGGSLAVIAGVIFLRQANVHTGGLVLLLLVPGFFYVTYQNFGNDPQWLLLVAVLLIALHKQAEDVVNQWGWNVRGGLSVIAAMCLAFAAPSFFNLAFSPFRHMNADVTSYAPILPRSGVHTDFNAADIRANRVDARVPLDGELAMLPQYEDRDAAPVLMGEVMPICGLELGLPRAFDVIARDIEDAGLAAGKSVFAADILSSYWLYGDLEPMDQGAPWYYGGLPGLQDADYVLVPLCPIAPDVQVQIFGLLDEQVELGTLQLTEVRRTEMYILYAKNELN